MPSVRAAHLILEDTGDEMAFWMWRVIVDAILWLESTKSPKRHFHPGAGIKLQLFPDQIRSELGALKVIYTDPDRVVVPRLVSACTTVSEWAEKQERVETALQYAELAARLSPEESSLCSTAGRLCRRRKELHRGTIWFRRATRLASAFSGKKRFRDLAIARLGWAYLAQDLGALAEAEVHATKAFRAARRCGRNTEAAYAYHALATTLIHQGRLDEAWVHARNAVSSYPADHPRFPALAHDIAFLWGKSGYFADAAVLYEKVLPTISKADERQVVLANLARAAAAAGDHLRYERAAREILRVLDQGGDVPTSARYHLARAALNMGDWRRAKMLADKIPPQSSLRWQEMLEELHTFVRTRSGRDMDLIPDYGSEVYTTRELLIKKLEEHTDPGTSPGSAASEKYPIS